jgi:hypothetical protein
MKKEYGYINEHGYLVSKRLENIDAETLNEGWKPVREVAQSKVICDGYYCTRIMPFDAGEYIDYKYERILNVQRIKNEIAELKEMLSSGNSDIGDYKITKCYEASLVGENAPYDIAELHQKRNEIREKINELSKMLK